MIIIFMATCLDFCLISEYGKKTDGLYHSKIIPVKVIYEKPTKKN